MGFGQASGIDYAPLRLCGVRCAVEGNIFAGAKMGQSNPVACRKGLTD